MSIPLIPSRHNEPRIVIGGMSGTSIDGIDLALTRIEGQGEDLRVASIDHVAIELGELQARLRSATTSALSAEQWTQLAHDLGQLHADGIQSAWPEITPDLVALHGQTLHHAPPRSLQLIDGWPIAHELRCPVVSNLRAADLAAGGQGAPITPRADQILYRNHLSPGPMAIMNLGGFINITLLNPDPLDPPTGFDCCPCNHLLDAAAKRILNAPFDRDGKYASAGSHHERIAQDLSVNISKIRNEGRSGGSGDEGLTRLEHAFSEMAELSGEDQLATIAEAIARSATRQLKSSDLKMICLAGGGVRNAAVHSRIQTHSECPVVSSDDLGIPIEAREAAAMAVLGLMAADGVDITNPESTGRSHTVQRSGEWIIP